MKHVLMKKQDYRGKDCSRSRGADHFFTKLIQDWKFYQYFARMAGRSLPSNGALLVNFYRKLKFIVNFKVTQNFGLPCQ